MDSVAANVAGMWELTDITTMRYYDYVASLYAVLTFTASGNLTVTNNGVSTGVNIFKTSGGSAWDNQAYVSQGFTAPCTLEFNKLASSSDDGVSYAMIAWNSDPLTDASYSSLDYAAYPYQTNQYQVYNNGSQSSYAAWNPSSKFYLVYATNGYMYHYNGSTLLASFNYGVGGTVYIDSSFYSVDATYSKFSSIRVTKNAWNGTAYA